MSRLCNAVCAGLGQQVSFPLPPPESFTYDYLIQQLSRIFQIDARHFTVTYHDDEGDSCTIGSNEELAEALRVAGAGGPLSIQVHWAPPESLFTRTPPASPAVSPAPSPPTVTPPISPPTVAPVASTSPVSSPSPSVAVAVVSPHVAAPVDNPPPVVIASVLATPVVMTPPIAVPVPTPGSAPSALPPPTPTPVTAMPTGDVGCPICSRVVSARDLNRHLDACLVGNGANVPPSATPVPVERETKGAASMRFDTKEDKRLVGGAGVATHLPSAPIAPVIAIPVSLPPTPTAPEAPVLSDPEQHLPLPAQLGLVLQRAGSNGEGRDKRAEDYRAAKLIEVLLKDFKVAASRAGGSEATFNADDLRIKLHEALVVILLDQQLDRETSLQWERRLHEDTLTFLHLENMTKIQRANQDREEDLSRIRIEEMQKAEREAAEVRRKTNQEADEFSVTRIQQELKMAEERKKIKEVQDMARTKLVGKYLPGEDEAMRARSYRTFTLLRESRAFGELAEYHFRYAESQFLRLTLGQRYRVTKVDYVVNPPLVTKFEAKQADFRKRGIPSEPTLCFHGTADHNIDSILKANFDVRKLGSHTGNRGAFGAGIYFSEYTSTSIAYNRSSRMLLSKVLMGRIYQCKGGMLGAPLTRGYDCHVAPGGHEIVIYDNAQILPCYVVHYEASHV